MASEARPLARGAVWLARAYLAIALALILAGGAAASLMHLELWSPGMSAPAERYAWALGVHGSALVHGVLMIGAALGLGHLHVAGERSGPTAWLSALAILPLLGGLVAVVAALAPSSWLDVAVVWPLLDAPDETLLPLARAAALLASALALDGVHFAVVLARRFRSADRIARASSVALLLGIAWQVEHLISTAVSTARGEPFFLFALDPLVSTGAALLSACAILVGALQRSLATSPRGTVPTPALYLLLGVLPCFWAGVLAKAFLLTQSIDVHLHDTYFVTGADHLFFGVALAALLAGVHAWADVLIARRPREPIARVGASLTCLGLLATSAAMLALGWRGLPRRLADYLPAFELHHRALTSSALIVLVGGLLVVLSLAAGRRT